MQVGAFEKKWVGHVWTWDGRKFVSSETALCTELTTKADPVNEMVHLVLCASIAMCSWCPSFLRLHNL